ncbi:MAG: hypothetical protein KDD94_03425, partial [Calditrichaeota bacterium]|nr:hypothetical protein [Calditrichota bacterium]
MINQRIKLLLRDSQRTLMLIAQFSLAILALNMLISEVSQIVRSLTLNLGFQVDHLIVGSISGLDNVNQNDFPKQYAALNAAMTDLQKQDFIESAGYLLFYPYSKSSSDSWSYSKNFLTVDALNTLKLNLRFGDLFTKNDEFSTNEYCLINMESYNEFKVFDPEPIGKNYYDLLAKVVQSTANDEILSELRKITPLIIKGVVDNFHMLGRYDLSTSKQLIKLAYSENQEHYQNQWGELYKLRNFVIRLRSGENEALARYKIYEILNSHLIGKNLSVESCKQLEQ